MNLTVKKLLDAMKKKDYPVAVGEGAINLIGIRTGNTDDFPDLFCVLKETDDKQALSSYPVNTDCTGKKHLLPGHYPDCLKHGTYNGRFQSLISNNSEAIYLVFAGTDPYTLKPYIFSFRQQVIGTREDFIKITDTVFSTEKQEKTYSYTLMEAADIA